MRRFFALVVLVVLALSGCHTPTPTPTPTQIPSNVLISGEVGKGVYFSPGPMGSDVEYRVDLAVKNTGDEPIAFDALEILFQTESGKSLRSTSASKSDSGFELMPNETKSFNFTTNGYTSQLLLGGKNTILNFVVTVKKGNKTIAGPLMTTLPRLSELPNYETEELKSLKFYKAKITIGAIGCEEIANQEAKKIDDNAVLVSVLANRFSTYQRDNEIYPEIDEWRFIYRSKGGSISIVVSRNGEIIDLEKKEVDEFSTGRPAITQWRIDIKETIKICEDAKAVLRDGIFMVLVRTVNEEKTPLWVVPYRLKDGRPFNINAATGAILVPLKDPDKWEIYQP
ncbi:hypothetical protein ACFL11_00035 [Patescibacteria group bacterium]